MLYSSREDVFESEKERNLYYKYFAGYYFNELVVGFEKRLSEFCGLLNRKEMRFGSAIEDDQPFQLSAENTHVSFDNHGYLFSNANTDRGEFADILVHDPTTRVLVPIEVKLHSDWSYAKDVEGNQTRLHKIQAALSDKGGHPRIIPCLLLSVAKWDECQGQEARKASQFARLADNGSLPLHILLWKDFLDLTTDKHVHTFLAKQLALCKKTSRYEIRDGWFYREARNSSR
jgi:hypothetical protein